MGVSIEARVPDYVISLRNQKRFEVRNSRVVFILSEVQRNHFNRSGIGVPAFDREKFGHKEWIKMDDPLFAKALREIYFPDVLKKMGYKISEEPAILTDGLKNLNITN
jgi:hypothetical protein